MYTEVPNTIAGSVTPRTYDRRKKDCGLTLPSDPMRADSTQRRVKMAFSEVSNLQLAFRNCDALRLANDGACGAARQHERGR